jgi:hypothetical protein
MKEFLRKEKPYKLNTTFLMNCGIWAQERFLKASKSKQILKKVMEVITRRKKRNKERMVKKKKKR